MAKCINCGKNEAALRDRNNPTSRRKTICRDCHAERLRGDFIGIVKAEENKKEDWNDFFEKPREYWDEGIDHHE